MAKAKLEKEVQIFIVQQLALFEKPVKVREAVKDNFNVEISLQAVMNYQVTNPLFPEKWRKLFESTRKRFLDEANDIPIANKSYRLRKLQNIFDTQETSKIQNIVEMRNTLEQAAKESGDVFTNKQKFEHSGAVQTSLILPKTDDDNS